MDTQNQPVIPQPLNPVSPQKSTSQFKLWMILVAVVVFVVFGVVGLLALFKQTADNVEKNITIDTTNNMFRDWDVLDIKSTTVGSYDNLSIGVSNIWEDGYKDETGKAQNGLTANLSITIGDPVDSSRDLNSLNIRVYKGQTLNLDKYMIKVIDIEKPLNLQQSLDPKPGGTRDHVLLAIKKNSENRSASNKVNWQIYANKTLGFSIQYPKDWTKPKVDKSKENNTFHITKISFDKNAFTIAEGLYENSKYKGSMADINDFINAKLPKEESIPQDIILDNAKGKKIIYENGASTKEVLIAVAYPYATWDILTISYTIYPGDDTTIDEMISTFKFQKPQIEREQSTLKEFPIKIVDNKIPANTYDPVEGGAAPCQPEFFDPKITKFHKVKQEGSPGELYQIEGDEHPAMMIDGWNKEGENKIILPKPFGLTYYMFGCASSFSLVLDLSKSGQRQALYTQVNSYSFSPDKRFLFLANNLKTKEGKWQALKRIIDINENKTVKLPNIECVSTLGRWDKDKLITYSDLNIWKSSNPGGSESDYKTKICLWNPKGQQLSQLEASIYWTSASKDVLDAGLGFLPKQPDIFYIISDVGNNNATLLNLYLQDFSKPDRHKTFELPSSNYEENGVRGLEYTIEFGDFLFNRDNLFTQETKISPDEAIETIKNKNEFKDIKGSMYFSLTGISLKKNAYIIKVNYYNGQDYKVVNYYVDQTTGKISK